MKAINKIISLWHCCLLLLPLVAGSCQEAITTDRDPASEPLPGNGSARFSVRAGDGTFPSTTIIGFYVQYAENKGVQYNVAGKLGNGGWVATSDWISNNPADVVVYAPYNKNYSKTEPHLSLAASLYSEGADIVSGMATVKATPGDVTITLAHVYTRLRFNLTKAVGDDSPETIINKIELHGPDIYPNAKYNPFTKAYTVEGQTDPPASMEIVSLPVNPMLTVSTTPASATLDLLVIPVRQSFTMDAYLWVYTTTTGEHPMKVTIPRNTTDQYPLAPGKQYTFNVLLSPTEPSITSVTVSEWVTGGSTDGDTE